MRHITRMFIMWTLILFGAVFIGPEVWAEGGGWIGSGTPSGGGASGGSGAACNTLSWPEQAALPRCQGYSWIFYESQVSKENAATYYFRPGSPVEISVECAEHADEGGGFWHLGTNAHSYNYGYTNYNFLSPGGDAGQYTKEGGVGSTYYTGNGYGHSATFAWEQVTSWNWLWYNTYSNSSLSHELYNGSTLLYKATKYGSASTNNDSEVWKNFKAAWKAKYGQDYTGNSYPGQLYAFCYWPGMEEVPEYKLSVSTSHATATVKRTSTKRNGASIGNLSSGDKIYKGDELTISFSPNSCYKWGSHTINGVSQDSGYSLTVNSDVNVVASAVVKSAKLYISQGAGTVLSVSRGGVFLANNTTLTCGDTIKTEFGLKSGYSWGTHTLNDSNINSGSTYKLTDDNAEKDVYVTTTAVRNEYAGKSMVSSVDGNWSTNTGKSLGYTQESGRENYYINDCDPVNGCTVKFWHYLQRKAGGGSVSYTISRTSNYGSISETTITGTQNFSSGNEEKN